MLLSSPQASVIMSGMTNVALSQKSKTLKMLGLARPGDWDRPFDETAAIIQRDLIMGHGFSETSSVYWAMYGFCKVVHDANADKSFRERKELVREELSRLWPVKDKLLRRQQVLERRLPQSARCLTTSYTEIAWHCFVERIPIVALFRPDHHEPPQREFLVTQIRQVGPKERESWRMCLKLLDDDSHCGELWSVDLAPMAWNSATGGRAEAYREWEMNPHGKTFPRSEYPTFLSIHAREWNRLSALTVIGNESVSRALTSHISVKELLQEIFDFLDRSLPETRASASPNSESRKRKHEGEH